MFRTMLVVPRQGSTGHCKACCHSGPEYLMFRNAYHFLHPYFSSASVHWSLPAIPGSIIFMYDTFPLFVSLFVLVPHESAMWKPASSATRLLAAIPTSMTRSVLRRASVNCETLKLLMAFSASERKPRMSLRVKSARWL